MAQSHPSEKKKLHISSQVSFVVVTITLLILTLAMFGDVLFSAGDTVLSKPHTDLFDQFACWREFGFNQLRNGNLALWNPHIFSGVPFLGGFQSALLYPLNVLFLIFPLAKAINFSIALHVFLIGVFMYLWAYYRRLHPLACLLSSVLLMFCGAHFMHIQAGHLPHLCTMTWAPLVFLSIDGFFEKRSPGWSLLGMFAVSMQILAGYPQHVFYTAVAAGVYSLLCLWKADKRVLIAAGLAGMYAGASALAAVQLFPGIQVAGESIRSDGLPYEFASKFSFPPENLVTFLSPQFFGNDTTVPYWGRWHLWEMSLFVGVVGFVLAVYGSVYGKRRACRFSVAMAGLLILLALGGYTPLFKILHDWIPGFDKFRGSSKFIFEASLFIAMLAGIGLDHMIRHGPVPKRAILAILVAGFIIGCVALSIRYSAMRGNSSWWSNTVSASFVKGESYLSSKHYADPCFVQKAGFFASRSLIISAGTFFLLSFLLFLLRSSRKMVYAVALLAVVEVFVFARTSRFTFSLSSIRSPAIERIISGQTGDYRTLNLKHPDSAMLTGAHDIWGNDSVVLRRYAEFITFTQGYPPDRATQYVRFSRFHHLYKMLRCRFAFIPSGRRIGIIEEKDVMPRVQLLQEYVIIRDRDGILREMADHSFDPRKKVILETDPHPEPVVSTKDGKAKVVDSSTDYLIIEADVPDPAILLITDAYSKGWRAKSLPGSIQKKYRVMPANYILRAIPLSKGHHRIRVEYMPLAFRIGKWVSICAVFVYIIAIGLYFQKLTEERHLLASIRHAG